MAKKHDKNPQSGQTVTNNQGVSFSVKPSTPSYLDQIKKRHAGYSYEQLAASPNFDENKLTDINYVNEKLNEYKQKMSNYSNDVNKYSYQHYSETAKQLGEIQLTLDRYNKTGTVDQPEPKTKAELRAEKREQKAQAKAEKREQKAQAKAEKQERKRSIAEQKLNEKNNVNNSPSAQGTGAQGTPNDYQHGHHEANVRGTEKPMTMNDEQIADILEDQQSNMNSRTQSQSQSSGGGQVPPNGNNRTNAQTQGQSQTPPPGGNNDALDWLRNQHNAYLKNNQPTGGPNNAENSKLAWEMTQNYMRAQDASMSTVEAQGRIYFDSVMNQNANSAEMQKSFAQAKRDVYGEQMKISKDYETKAQAKIDEADEYLSQNHSGAKAAEYTAQKETFTKVKEAMQFKKEEGMKETDTVAATLLNRMGTIGAERGTRSELGSTTEAQSKRIGRGDTSKSKKHGTSWTSSKYSGDQFRTMADRASEATESAKKSGISRFAEGDEKSYMEASNAWKEHRDAVAKFGENSKEAEAAKAKYEGHRNFMLDKSTQGMDEESRSRVEAEAGEHFEEVHKGEEQTAETEAKAKKADKEKAVKEGFVSGAKLFGDLGKGLEASGKRLGALNVSKGTMGQG